MTSAELPAATTAAEPVAERSGKPARSVPAVWWLAALYGPWLGLYVLDIGVGPRLVWGLASLAAAAGVLQGRGWLAPRRTEGSRTADASLLAALGLLLGGIVFGSPWLALASLQFVLLAGIMQRVPRDRRGAWLAAWGLLWLGLRLPGGGDDRIAGWYHSSVLDLGSQVLDSFGWLHARTLHGLGLPQGVVAMDPVGLGLTSVGLVALASLVYAVRRGRGAWRSAAVAITGLFWGYFAQVAALVSYVGLLDAADLAPRLPLHLAVQVAWAAAAFLLVFSTDRGLTVFLSVSSYILPKIERLPQQPRAARTKEGHRGRRSAAAAGRWNLAGWTGVWALLAFVQIPSWLVGYAPLAPPPPLPAAEVTLPPLEMPTAWSELTLIEQPAPATSEGPPRRPRERWTFRGPTRTLTVYRVAAAEGLPLIAGRYDEPGWDLVEVGVATPVARGEQRWMVREASWRQRELSLTARALVLALDAEGRCVELGQGQPASGVWARLFRHARGVAARLGSLVGLAAPEAVQAPAEVQLALVVEGAVPPAADERKRLREFLTLLAERHAAGRQSLTEARP